MKKILFISLLILPFIFFTDKVEAATSYDLFGTISETQKSVIDEYGNPVYSTCSNSYVTMDIFGGIKGWKSCDYSYTGSGDRLPNSFIWWFRNFEYTKGTNWEIKFRIYGSNLEFDLEKSLPNVTVATDYGSETCSVKYGGYYYLDVSCVGTSTNLFAITLWQEAIPILPTGYYVLSNHYSSIQTELDNSYIVNQQKENTQNLINNQNQNAQNIINNQQQNTQNIINNQNQNQQQTNEKLDNLNKTQQETNDYLKDNTAPNSDISSLGNVQGLLPAGPVDSLLNIPFQFLSILTNSFNGVCVPFTGPFVFGSTLTLPCFGTFYDEVPDYLMNFINLIPSAFILIKYFKHLYKKIDRAVSMESNTDDEWGVL